LIVLQYNFSQAQCKLHEDDRMIETCRSLLSISMSILNSFKFNKSAFVGE
jgi:hypothetical protein